MPANGNENATGSHHARHIGDVARGDHEGGNEVVEPAFQHSRAPGEVAALPAEPAANSTAIAAAEARPPILSPATKYGSAADLFAG